MKLATIICAFALLAFVGSTEALTTNDLLNAAVQQQEEGTAASLAALTNEHNLESHGAYALIKYIVVPSKAKEFISVIEEAKKDAEEFKGFKAYNLVKTIDDNISYIAWAAWESPKDLIDYLKSDAAKKVIEYVAKEDIVALVTGVRPIV